MSSQRLERMTALMQRAVDSGDLPGAVVMIARKGKLVYQHTVGMQDKARNVAMAPDSIFRAYSMTKPIVTVAAMILVEEGRLGLHEPISTVSARVQDHDRGGGDLRPGDRRGQLPHHPGQAPDHGARSDAAHLWTDLWRVPAQGHAAAKLYDEANLWTSPTSMHSPRRSRSCRCASSPARPGSTAIPPTCSAA